MLRIYEKGEIVTGEDLWALAAMSGIDVDKPVSANMLQRAGLNAALIKLKKTTGSYDAALRAAGFKTRASEHDTKMNESDLRAYLLAYNGNKRTPVRVRDMIDDHAPAKPNCIPGYQLAARLKMFAKENQIVTRTDGTKEYGTTQTDTIKYFGFRVAGNRRKKSELIDDLRAIWPKALVEQAYAGQTMLPQIADLKKSKTLAPLMHALERRGRLPIINRLYPEFPDLQNYVVGKGLAPANPDILRKQLRTMFYSGENVSANLQHTKNPHERKLYYRIMSLKDETAFGARQGIVSIFGKKSENKPATFNKILSYLLPEFSGQELTIEPGATKRQGTIGELFTEWLLRWSKALNPNGFGDAQFRTLFGFPVNAIYAGKCARKEDSNVVLPDIVTRGTDTTFVEVRTGERVKTATTLAKKYEDKTEFIIEDLPIITNPRKVAVLHMPQKAIKQAIPVLLDEDWDVVIPDQFVGWLEKMVKKVPEEVWNEASPRANVESIIDAYKRLVQSPISFIRPGGDYEMRFLKSTLDKLVRHEFEHVAS